MEEGLVREVGGWAGDNIILVAIHVLRATWELYHVWALARRPSFFTHKNGATLLSSSLSIVSYDTCVPASWRNKSAHPTAWPVIFVFTYHVS